MSRDEFNTQGSGSGAGTGSGNGSSSGAGTGTGNGGAGTGSGRRLQLAAAVLAVVVGLALLAAPLVDRWADPDTRIGIYLAALLAAYAVCGHVIARPRRTT